MPDSIGALEYKAAKDAGIEKIHFAYTGDPEPGKGYTYRVQGPSFVVEFLNMQADTPAIRRTISIVCGDICRPISGCRNPRPTPTLNLNLNPGLTLTLNPAPTLTQSD